MSFVALVVDESCYFGGCVRVLDIYGYVVAEELDEKSRIKD